MTKHTPGPWAYDPEIGRVYSLADNQIVASIHVAGNPACEAAWPDDARLIANAPDLLAALKAADNELDDEACENRIPRARARIRAAIAKAEGRS